MNMDRWVMAKLGAVNFGNSCSFGPGLAIGLEMARATKRPICLPLPIRVILI